MSLASVPRGLWRSVKSVFNWYFGLYRGRNWFMKIWIGFMTVCLSLFLFGLAVMTNFLWLFGGSPSLSEIMEPRSPVASIIKSADGKVIGKIFNENRTLVPYDSINSVFFDALVSTEDARFYSHRGIDFLGYGAAVKDAVGGNARGASTLSQQLVKNKFSTRSRYNDGLLCKIRLVGTLIAKTKEIVMALALEAVYSKEEILTMYANTVDFGSNAYGINTAAKTYFNTTPLKLKTEEAAVLVGLLKATNTYNPRLHPEASRERRNTVLHNMLQHGKLSQTDYDRLSAKEIKLRFNREDTDAGTASYFRQAVIDELRDKAPDLDPYVDGLTINTTLDSRMQAFAQQAVETQLRGLQSSFKAPTVSQARIDRIIKTTPYYQQLAARFADYPDSIKYYLNRKHQVRLFDYGSRNHERIAQMSTTDSVRYMLRFLHSGFVAMEPASGHVKAWIGDVDYKTWMYDKVRAKHQPGSTFKLFVYTAAMQNGHRPTDTYLDAPLKVNGKDWPANSGGGYSHQNLTLRSAFARSINTVAARIGHEVKPAEVAAVAHDMGIKSDLQENLAMCLGASEVSPLEMVRAYCAIPNGGDCVEPVLITSIYDSEGHLIYQDAGSRRKAIDRSSAEYMQQLLEAGAHDAGGTSTRLGNYLSAYNGQIDYGGKTGTTNDKTDAWFIGVTPALVGGAWVGGEYSFIRAGGYGGTLALPIFGSFIQKVMGNAALRAMYLKRYQGRSVAARSAPVPQQGISSGGQSAGRDSNYVEEEAPSVEALFPDRPRPNVIDGDEIERKSREQTEDPARSLFE